MSEIRHILFDIGVVLLHLDFERAVDLSGPLCDPARVGNRRQFLSLLERDPVVNRYERGELTALQFYNHFVNHAGFRGSFDQFTGIWRSIFSENKPMIALATELARTFKVYFLTNASDLHVPWIFDQFPSLNIFTDYACSYYLGTSKPDPDFYKKALSRFDIVPATCLFIDDMPENVRAAEALGIRSILYAEPASAITAVRDALRLT